MTAELTIDQINALAENANFKQALKDADGTDAIQKVFLDNDIEMTKDEVEFVIDYARKYKDSIREDGQLDEATLDFITGGLDIDWEKRLKALGKAMFLLLA